MRHILTRLFLIIIAVTTFSCSDGEDGIDGIDGVDGIDGADTGLEYLIFSGDITDEEAEETISKNLGRITHSVLVLNTTNLTTLDLKEVSKLIRIEVRGNENLQNLSFPNLESVIEDISIESNKTLTTINFEKLITAPFITFEDNAAVNIINLNNLDNSNRLEFRENPALETLNLPMLKEVGSLRLRPSESLSSLDVPNLEMVGSLSISETKLSEINLPKLETINGLFLQGNEDLQTFTTPLLANTPEDGASVTIRNNTALSSINFGAIDKFRQLRIENNDNLTVFEANSVAAITNTFTLSNNPRLTSFGLPSLVHIGARINISETNLTTINFESLATFSELTVDSDTLITSLNLSSVQDFSSMRLGNRRGLSTMAIDGILTRLVNITPVITGKSITIRGEVSAQATIDAQTLRDNGNSVSLSN